MKVIITKELEFSDQRVNDLLCCALEGGSDYWIGSALGDNPDKEEYKYLADLALTKNGGILIADSYGDMPPQRLDRATLQKGLEVMAAEYPKHLEAFWTENDDADTADAFLQCCCFGEVVYG